MQIDRNDRNEPRKFARAELFDKTAAAPFVRCPFFTQTTDRHIPHQTSPQKIFHSTRDFYKIETLTHSRYPSLFAHFICTPLYLSYTLNSLCLLTLTREL